MADRRDSQYVAVAVGSAVFETLAITRGCLMDVGCSDSGAARCAPTLNGAKYSDWRQSGF
jgi:hypothetical protein